MTAVNFGVGTIVGVRTDIANAPPAFMGIMQEIEIDFDQSLKELMGSYKMAVDVAPANLKVTGKAKFAQIEASTMNNLLFGQTETNASGFDMAVAEAGTVPAPSGPYTVTVSHSATFAQDLGVFYASTGVQLVPVASGPTVGQYSVSAGVYTFAAADASIAMKFYYSYTVTSQKQIALANQQMGVGPVFSLYINENYTNNLGVTNKINLKLNACRSSKLTLPFKNTDYTIQEFDFQAFADQSNNWGVLSTTE